MPVDHRRVFGPVDKTLTPVNEEEMKCQKTAHVS